MKKITLIIILLTTYVLHAQTDEKENLRRMNQTVISLYRNQQFDKSLELAQKAVDLRLKIYGAEQVETAVAYRNLGVMYQEKRKYAESVENLQKAIDIYQKASNPKNDELIMAYQILAYSHFLDGKNKDAEVNYLKAVEVAEMKFGKENKEIFLPTLTLANFYARDKNFEKADVFYLKSYSLALKNFGEESKEVEQIDDSRSCLTTSQKYNADSGKAFKDAKEKIFGRELDNSRILNGKATLLPIPPYPPEARSRRLSGMVSVKVQIDEQGNVIGAKTICGHPILGKASENAALIAKFEPALKDGKPIKVKGIIVYNFVP